MYSTIYSILKADQIDEDPGPQKICTKYLDGKCVDDMSIEEIRARNF